MQVVVCRTLALVLAMGLCAATVRAQPDGEPSSSIPPKHHPWGRFALGAWKLVRVKTETFDDTAKVAGTSTTETRITLDKIDADGVTLSVEACVEMAGKRFAAQPQTIRQGFHGEPLTDGLKIEEPTAAALVVGESRKIPCTVFRLENATRDSRTETKIYYSGTVAPYVLKRESVTTDPDGQTTLSEKRVETLALNYACHVLSQIKSGAHMKTVHKHARGITTTWADVCIDVPGGIVRHGSTEVDKTGRVVRRSVLELIDYGLKSDSLQPSFWRPGWFWVQPRLRVVQ